MRFTTALLSILLPAVFVTAEVECQLNSGGPSAGDKRSAIDAYVAKYAPDGVYHPQAGETLCMRCGNAQATGGNSCLDEKSATRDQLLEAFNEMAGDGGADDCTNLVWTEDFAILGCLAVNLATPGQSHDECQFYC